MRSWWISRRKSLSKSPSLIVLSGLPGTGKTSVSKSLVTRLGAVYLRIDEIETAMKTAGITEPGAAGYMVAMALAKSNLDLGTTVIADCVNPVQESRAGWHEVAARTSARLTDILLVCSDTDEHRRRVEARRTDIPGHVLPTWEGVATHMFEPHNEVHLVLDSAKMTPEQLARACLDYLNAVDA